jgi:hypothetical protein
MKEAIRRYLEDRDVRIDEFENVTVPSKPYQGALTRLNRITAGFIEGHRALALYTSRQPQIYRDSLMYAFSDDFLESAIDVATGISIGTHHAAQRELRYVLENAVKSLFVDQQKPDEAIGERIKFLADKVPRGSIDVVDHLLLGGLEANVQAQLRHDARGLFADLSAFVHPSASQLGKRLTRSRQGLGAGFDTAKELERATKTMFRTYDLVIVLLCHGIGLGMAGDLFIQVWDADVAWPFHKGKFTRELSRYFDYKMERHDRPNSSITPS